MAITENAEGQWWDEEADRVNRMAELARQKGMVISVTPKAKAKVSKKKPTKKEK